MNSNYILIKLTLLAAFFVLGIASANASSPMIDSPLKNDTLSRVVNLNEVVVKPGKEKYSKKNNKAVSLIEMIRKNADTGSPYSHDYYTCEKYDNICIALNGIEDSIGKKSKFLKQFSFLNEYIDTSAVTGRPILPISIKEKVTQLYYRRSPESRKEFIVGIKRKGVDEIADQENVQVLLEDIFRDIDLYQNDINLLSNRFVSPLSKIGPDFYKYYLTDTIVTGSDSLFVLTFAPHNNAMFGFAGRLYVERNDTSLFIKKASMILPHRANVNFIDNLMIEQNFVRDSLGTRLKTDERLTAEIAMFPGTPGIYVEKFSRYYDHDFSVPQKIDIFGRLGTTYIAADSYLKDDDYWEARRGTQVQGAMKQYSQAKVGDMIAGLRSVPMYYYAEKFLKIIVTGYVPIGKANKFQFGPVNTMVSFNDVEGMRLRGGGLTTARLNRHIFSRGYVAYGTKDEKWKYYGELEYSFNAKKNHSREFPDHSLRLGYKYDVDAVGQHYAFTNPDNIFLSLKRLPDTLMLYRRNLSLDYTLELENHFSVKASAEMSRLEGTKYIPFRFADGRTKPYMDFTSFTIALRYAPGEKFVQSKSRRTNVNSDAPVFMLTHTFAPAHFLGSGRFTVNKTEFNFMKRFWFSAFGYSDVILKAGHVWSVAPFTELLIPNANLSYTIQPESFQLMSPMEFVTDSYLSWDLTYWGNGVVFNYIPLLKRLKLREVVAFRGFWGDLSDRNNPLTDNRLPLMPASANPQPMESKPYMEISAGLDNIFQRLRVDYVWRLSYRNTPGVDRHGLRVALHFTF